MQAVQRTWEMDVIIEELHTNIARQGIVHLRFWVLVNPFVGLKEVLARG
jgi:hypothetical protein